MQRALAAQPTPTPTPTATPVPDATHTPTPPPTPVLGPTIYILDDFRMWGDGQTNFPGSVNVSYLIPANASIDPLFVVVRTDKSLEGGELLAVWTTFNPIIDGLAHTETVSVDVPPTSDYEDVFGITNHIELQLPPTMEGTFDVDG